jgi:hypothetical protein
MQLQVCSPASLAPHVQPFAHSLPLPLTLSLPHSLTLTLEMGLSLLPPSHCP